MTRTVMDGALMLQAMAGPDPCDPHALGLPVPDFVAAVRPEGDLKGVRIAWRPLLGNTMLSAEAGPPPQRALPPFAPPGPILPPRHDQLPPTPPLPPIPTQTSFPPPSPPPFPAL